MEFKPDRFLTDDGELDPNAKDPTCFFGFGRRLCPGRHLALDSMWLSIVCILATFDIQKARDAQGNEITPKVEYYTALLRYGFCLIATSMLNVAFVVTHHHSQRL